MSLATTRTDRLVGGTSESATTRFVPRACTARFDVPDDAKPVCPACDTALVNRV